MKITASISTDWRTKTRIFNTAEEFEAEKKRLYDQINCDGQGNRLPAGWYARQQLRDEFPDRFPCLMIYNTDATDNGDGPSIIENFFLYDFEILEGSEDEED